MRNQLGFFVFIATSKVDVVWNNLSSLPIPIRQLQMFLLGEAKRQRKKHDLTHALVNTKMKALLTIAKTVQVNGRNVTPAMVNLAKREGATDRELHGYGCDRRISHCIIDL